MTPEEARGNRTIQTINPHASVEILFYESARPALLRVHNDRGPIEVLVSEEKVAEAMPILCGERPITLTGFFRRRSGYRADGTRHFIWCLVLLTAEEIDQELKLAA